MKEEGQIKRETGSDLVEESHGQLLPVERTRQDGVLFQYKLLGQNGQRLQEDVVVVHGAALQEGLGGGGVDHAGADAAKHQAGPSHQPEMIRAVHEAQEAGVHVRMRVGAPRHDLEGAVNPGGSGRHGGGGGGGAEAVSSFRVEPQGVDVLLGCALVPA